ncbi:MAG: hypothetical protein L6Q54_06380 [Leptospiraceae bacterium]|nr:hypothetical protein [Leptospiraceae bacterium]
MDSPLSEQPLGAKAPDFCDHSKVVRHCLRTGIRIDPNFESETCGNIEERYQFGLCKPCLIDRFKSLRNLIDEVRS